MKVTVWMINGEWNNSQVVNSMSSVEQGVDGSEETLAKSTGLWAVIAGQDAVWHISGYRL